MTKNSNLPLITIVGPTASGKTSLAIDLAERFDGEIICADSRTIYKDMNIGTAKPGLDERRGVKHWGLDLVSPGEKFSAWDFKIYAQSKIEEARKRNKIPFLVGGTGLYVDSVLFDFEFGEKPKGNLRDELMGLTIDQLQNYSIKNNASLPENRKNKRHLIRNIERKGLIYRGDVDVVENGIVVGIATNKYILHSNIDNRIEQMFYKNVVKEATKLGVVYGWDNEAMTGNIYRIIKRMVDGEIGLAECKSEAAKVDRRLAKRQMTWFRRNPHILWASLNSADGYLTKFIAQCRLL